MEEYLGAVVGSFERSYRAMEDAVCKGIGMKRRSDTPPQMPVPFMKRARRAAWRGSLTRLLAHRCKCWAM